MTVESGAQARLSAGYFDVPGRAELRPARAGRMACAAPGLKISKTTPCTVAFWLLACAIPRKQLDILGKSPTIFCYSEICKTSEAGTRAGADRTAKAARNTAAGLARLGRSLTSCLAPRLRDVLNRQ